MHEKDKTESESGLLANGSSEATPVKQQSLLSHWYDLSKEAGGAVPQRDHFSPDRVGDLLANLLLVERTLTGFVIRYVGSAVEGMDDSTVVGTSFMDAVPPPERPYFGALFHAVLDTPCGVRFRRVIHLADGSNLRLESLELPLADDTGQVIYSLGLYDIEHCVEAGAQYRCSAAKDIMSIRGYLQVGICYTEFKPPVFVDLGAGSPRELPDPPVSAPMGQARMATPANNP